MTANKRRIRYTHNINTEKLKSNSNEIFSIQSYFSSNLVTVNNFLYIGYGCEMSTPEHRTLLSVYKEDSDGLNSLDLIYTVDTIQIYDFKAVTDLTNNSYILIQSTNNEFYQFNVYMVISEHINVKQVDLGFKNDANEAIADLQIDELIEKQVSNICLNDKLQYK